MKERASIKKYITCMIYEERPKGGRKDTTVPPVGVEATPPHPHHYHYHHHHLTTFESVITVGPQTPHRLLSPTGDPPSPCLTG